MTDQHRQQQYQAGYGNNFYGQNQSGHTQGASTSYGKASYNQNYDNSYGHQQDPFRDQEQSYYQQPQQGQQGYQPQGAPYMPARSMGDVGQGYGPSSSVPDAFVSDLAAGVLRQQGENYFQRGQAYVQSKMGFLSSSNLHYHFNVDTSYVREKLFMLLLPFLKQWSFSRKPEQISGGHRYQPPRQDTYAPDLYIPFMAVCTYIVLVSIVQTMAAKFTHDNVYVTVSGAFTAWLAHWVVIKLILYLLGAPSAVPFLEILALAGYPFLYACLGLGASMATTGLWIYRAIWVYGSLAMGTFLVRTMKHVLFHDSPHFRKLRRS